MQTVIGSNISIDRCRALVTSVGQCAVHPMSNPARRNAIVLVIAGVGGAMMPPPDDDRCRRLNLYAVPSDFTQGVHPQKV